MDAYGMVKNDRDVPSQRMTTGIDRVLCEEVSAQAVRLDLLTRLLGRMLQESMEHQDSSSQQLILFASVLKAKQAGKAVQLLADEGFVEEIIAIGRTLIEVTVNAAYLQSAGERELDRYVEFQPRAQNSSPAHRSSTGLMRRVAGQSMAFGLAQRLSELVLRRTASTRNGADPSWTTRSLLDRARISDSVSNIPVMVPLVQRVYAKGHAAVHGTVSTLGTFAAALETGQAPQREDRLAALSDAFFGINLNLLTLCHYLNSYLHLGMDEAIGEATSADSGTRPSLLGE